MGRAEVALTAVGKGLRERISTNRIYCSLKERCKERMRVGGVGMVWGRGLPVGGCDSPAGRKEGVNGWQQEFKWKWYAWVSQQRG